MVDKQVARPWRAFGRELKRQMDLAGKTQAWLAKETGYSSSLISALVQGTRKPKADLVAVIDSKLATKGVLARLAATLTGGGVPDGFRDVLSLERESSQILEYQPIVIPGIFQTEAYARRLIEAGRPWDGPEGVEQVLRVRMARTQLLARTTTPIVWAVLDSAAVRRTVGTPEIMREQWQHLVDLVETRRIRLQVVSNSVDHPGLCPPFRLMKFSDRPTIAYGDRVMGGQIITDSEDVRRVEMVFAALQGEALSPHESLEVLKEEIN